MKVEVFVSSLSYFEDVIAFGATFLMLIWVSSKFQLQQICSNKAESFSAITNSV